MPPKLYRTSVGDGNRKIERPVSPVADVDYTEICAEPFEAFHSDACAEQAIFTAHYQIGNGLPGGVSFDVNLLVASEDKSIVGKGHQLPVIHHLI